MNAWFCDHHAIPLPEGHPFPIEKYGRLRQELLDAGVLTAAELHAAEPAPLELIELAHDPEYVRQFAHGTLPAAAIRRIGFPWSEQLVRRSLASVHGTVLAARAALQHGIAGNLAGGTHHAHRGFGSGYCVFNDLAVAACALLDEGLVGRVAILDLDVHQGDGSAAMFAAEPRVFTCSVHGARNFPLRKERSDVDLALPDGAGDDEYLQAVDAAVAAVLAFAPDLVLYQAGVDVLAEDRLGRLKVSLDGLRERDRRVLRAAGERGLPIALTLGGGYARPLDPTIAAHVGTWVVAREVFD